MGDRKGDKKGGAPPGPLPLKIYSHSPKFSFWSTMMTETTKAQDVINTVAGKINANPADVVLYEVGNSNGLLIERRMANEELVLPLFKYWQQEKLDKKFSINVEPRASASVPTVDVTPAPESASQRPSSSISGAADKLPPSSRPASALYATDAPTPQRASSSKAEFTAQAQSFVIEEIARPMVRPQRAVHATSLANLRAESPVPLRADSPARPQMAQVAYSEPVPGAVQPQYASRPGGISPQRTSSPMARQSATPPQYAQTAGQPAYVLQPQFAQRASGVSALRSSGAMAEGTAHAALTAVRKPPQVDEQVLSDLTRRLEASVGALAGQAVSGSSDPQLVITPDIAADIAALHASCFGPSRMRPGQQIMALLTQGDDNLKEQCLRYVTHLTTDTTNQSALGQSALPRALVPLLAHPTPLLQSLAAWSFSNLASMESNRDRIREANAIPGLCWLLTNRDTECHEQALRTFCHLLKNNESNRAAFSKAGGVVLLFGLLARPGHPEAVGVLSLRVLMMVNWSSDVKVLVARVGGLSCVLPYLSNSNPSVKKMASWIVSTLAVDPTCAEQLREYGGTPALIGLLGEQDAFVREQAVTVLANLAVNPSNLDSIREAGGIKGCLQVALQKDASDTLRLRAVWALSNILVSDENQQAFQETPGAVKCIVHFLSSPNVKIQQRAAAAIVNLTQSSDSLRGDIGACGGVPALVNCLGSPDPELQDNVLKCLVNLSLNLGNEQIMCECAIRPLLDNLSGGDRQRELCVMTLANLALNDRVRNTLREQNGLVPALMVFLQPGSDELRYQSLKLLTNLAVNGRNRAFFVKKGLLPRIVQLSESRRPEDEHLLELASMAVGNLNFPVDEVSEEQRSQPVNQYIKALVEQGVKKDGGANAANFQVGDFDFQRLGGADRGTPEPDNFNAQREEAEAELRALQQQREAYKEALLSGNQKAREEASHKISANVSSLRRPTVVEGRRASEAPPVAVVEEKPPELSPAEKEKKRLARIEKRAKIAAEILVTEKTYVDSLNVMIKKYMNPMMAAAASKKPPVTEAQVKQIFSISELILNFHSMFYEGLETRILTWSEETILGDYFLRMVDFLRSYTQYVNNYEHAIKLLEELEKKPAFVTLLQKCTTSEDVKGLNLYSYLIMPIQRPPRYELLLNELLRNTDERHRDYMNIKNAGELVVEINLEVDEKKRLDEARRKIVELDTRVLQPKGETLVGPNRCLVREGAVTSGGSALTLFLFTDLVMIARRVEHPTLEKFESIQKLPMASVQVADLIGDSVERNQFKLSTTQGYSYLIKCETVEAKESWLADIGAAVAALRKTVPGFRG